MYRLGRAGALICRRPPAAGPGRAGSVRAGPVRTGPGPSGAARPRRFANTVASLHQMFILIISARYRSLLEYMSYILLNFIMCVSGKLMRWGVPHGSRISSPIPRCLVRPCLSAGR